MSRVAVHGLGMVGLPLAVRLADTGPVCGVERDRDRLEALRAGRPPAEPGLAAALATALAADRLRLVAEPEPSDAHLVCVPTPIDDRQRADLSDVHRCVRDLHPHLRPGDLVVIESTAPPGTVDGLAADGPAGVLWAVAPERVLPGAALAELVQVPRVVGGLTPEATRAAAALYRDRLGVAVHETDARTAACAKLVENASRDAAIAIANELAALAEAAGADGAEVLRLASTHPRVSLLAPGIGVGGHCLPVDPWFLVQIAPELATVIPAARAANEAATSRALDRVRARADADGAGQIGVLGLAYKADTGDTRNSPALRIARALVADGRRVVAWDPHAPDDGTVPRAGLDAVLAADLRVLLVPHAALPDDLGAGPLLDLSGGRR